jgi:hypothetical protein
LIRTNRTLGVLLYWYAPLQVYAALSGQAFAAGQEAAALNPFGERSAPRADSVPGYLELSSRTMRPGKLSLTRDARLKIFDETTKQHREVPLRAIRRVDCSIDKEWMEQEWRFKENASDEKVYTGRSYPVREYRHKIILRDGRVLEGPLSALIYLERPDGGGRERFVLHKRDKGPIGSDLKSMVYVRTIVLGERALDEANRKLSKGGAIKDR